MNPQPHHKLRKYNIILSTMKTSILTLIMILSGLANASSVSLDGEWKFSLGENSPLDDTIRLPTTTDIARKGDGRLNGEVVERIHPQLVGGDVMQQLTSHPLRRYPFVGIARYEREIEIPESWRGKIVTLKLERTKIVRPFIFVSFHSARITSPPSMHSPVPRSLHPSAPAPCSH